MIDSVLVLLAKYEEGTLTTLAATLLAALIAAPFIWLKHSVSSRVNVRRVLPERGCNWAALADLHNETFPPGLGAEGPDLRVWLSHFREHREWVEYLIIAEQKSRLVGYLFAHYHRLTRFGSISYFGVDQNTSPRDGIFHKLLTKFFACLHKDSFAPRAVLTELDPELPGLNRHKAFYTHLNNFGECAERLGHDAYVIVGFDYQPPLLDLEEIRATNETPPRNHHHLLLYICRAHRSKRLLQAGTAPSHAPITKDHLLEVLDFIIRHAYVSHHDGLSTCDEYKRYADALFASYETTIRDTENELLLKPAHRYRSAEASAKLRSLGAPTEGNCSGSADAIGCRVPSDRDP